VEGRPHFFKVFPDGCIACSAGWFVGLVLYHVLNQDKILLLKLLVVRIAFQEDGIGQL